MEWLALHLKVTWERTIDVIDSAHAMVADSRRILDSMHSRAPTSTSIEPSIRICLLCDAKGIEMHPLAFRITTDEGFNGVRAEAYLREGLNRFGVCKECFDKNPLQRVRIKFDLNRALNWMRTPARVLH